MFYEFGELGYDYSISSKRGVADLNDGYRTDPKNLRWDYYDVPERRSLYDTYAKLLNFRNQYVNTLSLGNLTTNISTTDWPVRKIRIDQNDMSFLLIGNFDASLTMEVDPAISGNWYDLMTGVQTGTAKFNLPAGQFKIFTSKQVAFSNTTDVKVINDSESFIRTYPNPVHGTLYFDEIQIKSMVICNLVGSVVGNYKIVGNSVDISGFSSGVYLIQFNLNNGRIVTQKILVE